jgi:hypothetical protein
VSRSSLRCGAQTQNIENVEISLVPTIGDTWRRNSVLARTP